MTTVSGGATPVSNAPRPREAADRAAEDLNLDALATLGTLASFVARRRD